MMPRILLIALAFLLALAVLPVGCLLVQPGNWGVSLELPSGHAEVREIRERYRSQLDPLVKRWEKADPAEKSHIESEAQPLWDAYRNEVTEACRRHGLHTPQVRQRWAETVTQPWEK